MSNIPSFFFNDTATTEIYTLSLHDALPISLLPPLGSRCEEVRVVKRLLLLVAAVAALALRSEEHTSELQSRSDLVCRLLLEKKINLLSGPSGKSLRQSERLPRQTSQVAFSN